MQVFRTSNYLSGTSLLVRVPAGMYAGFLIRIDGLNVGGQTAGANFGRIRLNRNGVELLNLDADVLQFVNDIDLGYIESVSSIGATYKQSAYIPASLFPFAEDKNIFYVADDDLLNIEIVYNSAVQTVIASATIAVGGNFQLGVENYTPIRLQETPNLPTGTTPEVFRGCNNFIGLYMTYTNTTRLLVEVDGGVYVNGDIEEVQCLSNLLNHKEAAYTSMVKVDVTQGRSTTEALSDELKVTFTVSASETPRCVPTGMKFDIARQNRSRQYFLEIRSQKMQRALITGKPAPVPTVPHVTPVPILEPTPMLA
jgi:hypothetical protein